jgi:dihydrofolate synthase/folylpolyglutamate synthase
MNYAEAVEHLYALGPELPSSNFAGASTPGSLPAAPRRKFELDHMRTLCSALGDPQRRVPSVLIAGTNGKGSTAATLASILNAAGYRTGLYTSPHLIRVNERIQVTSVAGGGAAGVLTPIEDDAFAALYTRVDEACVALLSEGKLPYLPSFFERLTAVAFLFFAGEGGTGEARADIMVL